MLRLRNKYWSCTNFADKIRGTTKPGALAITEWAEWHKTAKSAHPFRYWVAEKLLDKLQNILNYPLDIVNESFRLVNNRIINPTYMLRASKAHLNRNESHSLSDRILYCLFDELVDFVEIDQAWANIAFNSNKLKNLSLYEKILLRNFKLRKPEEGIEYLKNQAKLSIDNCDLDFQSEILDLYFWYKNTYSSRKSASELSGWSAYCANKRNKDKHPLDFDEEDDAESIISKMTQIEEEQYAEDTRMLNRLVELRKYLWI